MEYDFKKFQEDMGWSTGGPLLKDSNAGDFNKLLEARLYDYSVEFDLNWMGIGDPCRTLLTVRESGYLEDWNNHKQKDKKGNQVDYHYTVFEVTMPEFQICIFRAHVFHKYHQQIQDGVLKMLAKLIHETVQEAHWVRDILLVQGFLFCFGGQYEKKDFTLKFNVPERDREWLQYWRAKLGNRSLTLIQPMELRSTEWNHRASGYNIKEMLFSLERQYFNALKRMEAHDSSFSDRRMNFFCSLPEETRNRLVEGDFRNKKIWIGTSGSVWTWDASKSVFVKGLQPKEEKNEIRL